MDRPLWAPWRIEFIRSEKDGECFLCGREKPGPDSMEERLIVHRGKTAFIILNRYPYNSGHLMITPYEHTGELAALSPDVRAEMMELCVESQNVLTKVMNPEGFNIGFNLGSAAGAGIADHLHMHIVPRWVGDNNFMAVVGDNRVVPESLEATARLIRSGWK
jgi:ATP adenylyltransferase